MAGNRPRLEYKYAAALTVAVGLFMAILDSTIVNVALNAMRETFRTDLSSVQWVITAYFLAQAAVIPVAGYFGSRFGLKRLYLLALGAFTLGSLLCALSPRLAGPGGGDGWLVACRVFQGLGGGMLFPLGTAIVFAAFPPAERAASSAYVGVPIFLAPALGPTVGGLLVDSPLGWPGIFAINVPIGLAALLLVARVVRPDAASVPAGEEPARAASVPADDEPARAGFDWVGLALSMAGAVLVVYAFTLVSQTRAGSVTAQNPAGAIHGWGYWPVYALLAAGLASLALFGLYELRAARDPVLDLRLFATPSFSVASVMTWAVRGVIFGSFFLIPLFLQQFRGYSAVRTGLILMPQGAASAVAIVIGSRLYDRIGPRATVSLGMILLTASSALMVRLGPESDARFLIPILIVRGLGFGWAIVPLQTLALSSVTGRALPKATSLYNATGQIFTSIGVSVLATLLVQHTAGHAAGLAVAARAAGAFPPPDLRLRAGAGAMDDVFLIITVVTGLAAIVGLLLPAQSLKQQGRGGAEEPSAGGTVTRGRAAEGPSAGGAVARGAAPVPVAGSD